MSDWYVSSASYAAIAAFVPSAVYSVGNIVKPTAPALKAQWAFRCTTAGTASTEPGWATADGATNTTGGATFTNVTGRSVYGWSAAAGDLATLLATGAPRFAGGDRIFVSSDHSETQTSATTYGCGANAVTASYASGQVLCVNRAGSVPPVAADLATGAAVTISSNNAMTFETIFPTYHYGITFSCASSTTSGFVFGLFASKAVWFDTCQLYLTAAGTNVRHTSGTASKVVFNNTTLRFSNAGQFICCGAGSPLEVVWLNTPSAVLGTIPNPLFKDSSGAPLLVTGRGIDLSAITGTLVANAGGGSKILFDSCRIAAGVTRYSATAVANTQDLVELVNCFDGTNFISESYQPSGAVTTEFTITLSGGATDNVGTFSHKMVSNANVDKYVQPLTGFWMDANYATTGSAKTATVEIISSASLNNDEISLLLEYEGTASSSVASIATSLPANVLTAASAVTASTATWNSSPATPVRQHLQVTFTPRTAGRLRAQVRLGKASATVWYNPQVAVT